MRYIIVAFMVLLPNICLASWDDRENDSGVSTWQENAIANPGEGAFGQNIFPNPEGLLDPARPDAYGPGLNSDGTGRPFYWQPQGMPDAGPNPTLKFKPNAYGPGIGMDQYGGPVQPHARP